MSFDSTRQDIYTAVEAAKAGFTEYAVTIEYDNNLVIDASSRELPFLRVRVKFLDGMQVDLSNAPIHRVLGQIHLAAAVKEGAGVSVGYRLLDHFYPQLQRKSLGAVRTHMAKVTDHVKIEGWVHLPVIIPFWTDKFS